MIQLGGIPPYVIDNQGNTLLHIVIEEKNKDMAGEILAINPGLISVKNNDGQTPVEYALGHSPAIFELIKELAVGKTTLRS